MVEESFNSNPYKKEEKKTLSEVIISQIDKCAEEFSKEMIKGYTNEQMVNGQKVLITHPDQRFKVINHTQTLHDLLLFFFDEEIKKNIKTIKKKMESEKETKLKTYFNMERNSQNKIKAEQLNDFPSSALGDLLKDRYLNNLVDCYRQMFRELVLLFKRKHELSRKKTARYD